MTTWFERIKSRFGSKSGSEEHIRGRLSAGEWTIPGITFDTTGWRLGEADTSKMAWTAPNATLTLIPLDTSPSPPLTLTRLRNDHRATARARGEDIVQVDMIPVLAGNGLQVIYKRRAGMGYGFRGLLELRGSGHGFRIESYIDEGNNTGTREAMVSAMRVSCGEFALGPQNPNGSYRILGFQHDPYDATFDEEALNSVSDDERIDIVMPGHPLSRTRVLLQMLVSSLEVAGPLEPPSAPTDSAVQSRRQELSSAVLMAIYGATGRHDLVEHALQERIAALGETASPELAAALMQLGITLHLRDRAGNALPLLSRAERMFVEVSGEGASEAIIARVHHARALLKIGRHGQAGPMFVSAIKTFEKQPVDGQTYLLALASAGQCFAQQGNAAAAAEYLGRAQSLMERMKQEPTH
jgi:hypothetical protein